MRNRSSALGLTGTPPHRDPKENPLFAPDASRWLPKAPCQRCAAHRARARTPPALLRFVGSCALLFSSRFHQPHTADGFCRPNPLLNSIVAISFPPTAILMANSTTDNGKFALYRSSTGQLSIELLLRSFAGRDSLSLILCSDGLGGVGPHSSKPWNRHHITLPI